MAKKHISPEEEIEKVKDMDRFCLCEEDECTCAEPVGEDFFEEEEDDKAAEYLEKLQRTQAEFDNYRKRNALLALAAKKEGIASTIEKLLPVLDSFNEAEKHAKKEDLKGLNLVHEQMNAALKALGVERIEANNQTFDPHLHNAIMVNNEDDKEDDVILQVLQEGYTLNDKVIRHSVVIINKK